MRSSYSLPHLPVRLLAMTLAAVPLLRSAEPPAMTPRQADPSPEMKDASLVFVDVRRFGAKGDGVTDDSEAIIAAREAVFSEVANGEIARVLYFPAGRYRITKPDTLFDSDPLPRPRNNYRIEGAGKYATQIFFDSDAGPSADPRAGNLFTAANRLRRLRVARLRFDSNNPHQSCFYFWSRDTRDNAPLFPEYGTGSNQDFVFEDVAWAGRWKRGIGLDGDQQANLNSEMAFERCHLTNSASFTDAFLHSGITKPEAHKQQDQFFNFWFTDCKFEYREGDCLKFNKGGFINVRGGSWIILAEGRGGTFFKMGDYSHFDSCMNLSVVGTRLELRNANTILLDTYWSGPSAHITFQNISDAAHGYRPFASEANPVRIRARNGLTPSVRFLNCELMGYHKVFGSESKGGRIVYDQCNFRNYTNGGVAADANFLRYEGAAPRYRFIDCYGAADEAND